jgi:allophanate hydrolase
MSNLLPPVGATAAAVDSNPTSKHRAGAGLDGVAVVWPRTVAGWLQAVLDGQDLPALLQACHAAAVAAQPLALWIHLCPPQQFHAQLQTLQQRLRQDSDRLALLRSFPLLGVPFAVKDNIDIAGAPTTAACPAFEHTAEDDAMVVHKLLQAGALWVGKTNLDQFATGLVGTRSPYGRPSCAADPARISGGSSSGSAVAVARGLVAFALGTDTAGSGRIPAGLNGVVGLKPTPGRVGNTGVVPACRSLDCVSVLAHGVDDAAHVLAVIEGDDPGDPYSRFRPGPAATGAPLRLGVPRALDLDASLGYDSAWQAALDRAQAQGHELVEIDFSALDAVAALLYDGPWVAERHVVVQQLMATQPQALDATVREVIARAVGMTATQAFEAQYALRAAQRRTAELWQSVDALMVPTAPTHPRFEDVDADPLGCNARMGRYTNFVNLLGWCALAVPAGPAALGLPFGVTFIGPADHDAVLAGLGQRWLAGSADEPPSSQPPAAPTAPLLSPATQPTLTLAVVGAHLRGLPLNGQLVERSARFLCATRTAPHYRLFALPGTTPPKPGLVRVPDGGVAIEVELWAMPAAAVGSFLALIPAPLGLGTLHLADGSACHGFLCESHALAAAQDISQHGGWRAFMATQAARAPDGAPTSEAPSGAPASH